MFKSIQSYMYVGIAVVMLGIISYFAYVFHDRAEAKETVIKQESIIETKTMEIKLIGISEHAKGQIEQVDKEKTNEADTSFGVHSYTF